MLFAAIVYTSKNRVPERAICPQAAQIIPPRAAFSRLTEAHPSKHPVRYGFTSVRFREAKFSELEV